MRAVKTDSAVAVHFWAQNILKIACSPPKTVFFGHENVKNHPYICENNKTAPLP